jgi:hypothetical protein
VTLLWNNKCQERLHNAPARIAGAAKFTGEEKDCKRTATIKRKRLENMHAPVVARPAGVVSGLCIKREARAREDMLKVFRSRDWIFAHRGNKKGS